MKSYKFEAKNIEELKNKIEEELQKKDNEIIISINEEEKTGLFKGKKVEAKVVIIEETINFVIKKLEEITKLMGLECNFESRSYDEYIKIKIFSNNNAVLIGKNGRTLEALQIILKQILSINTEMKINILLDVEDYKENQQKNIEYIAKKTAREVKETKKEQRLYDMNSYERRLVHSILNDIEGIYTESEGEEPNRYVVIKPNNK